MTMAIGWLLQVLTHSAFWVGAGVFMVQAPIVVLSPLAGVYADRLDRARMMAAAFGLAALACVLLGAAALFSAELPLILFAALLFGVAYSFQTPNWNALAPNLVPPADLGNAVALLTTARLGAEFVGPLLAGPLLVALGPGAVFGLAALFYIGALILALRIPARRTTSERGTHAGVWRELGEGLTFVRRRPQLAVLFVLVGLHCVLTMAYTGILPGYTVHLLNSGSRTYGALMTVVGLGAAVGTLSLATVTQMERRAGLFSITALVSGLSVTGLGLSHSVWLALVAAALMGISQASFMTILQVYLQIRVDDRHRGRVMSLFTVVTLGTMAFGNWLWGALGQALGSGWVLMGLGLLFTAIATPMLLFSPNLRSVYLTAPHSLSTKPAG